MSNIFVIFSTDFTDFSVFFTMKIRKDMERGFRNIGMYEWRNI